MQLRSLVLAPKLENDYFKWNEKCMCFLYFFTYLTVSKIIVNNTNFPSNGTTNDVGGMISANSKKNTVNDSKIDILNDTCNQEMVRIN